MYEPTEEDVALRKCFVPDSLSIKWISVHDRLPIWTEDPYHEVLVYTEGVTFDNYCELMIVGASDFYAFDEAGDHIHEYIKDVTHWAKLPINPNQTETK